MNIDREIVARAMDKAGEEPINESEWAEGKSTRIRLIKDNYLATILETLAAADWTSQKKRARLTLSEEINLSTYTYMYELPIDCAKPCELADGCNFTCEGGFLYTECADAVLVYVKNYFTGKLKYEKVASPDESLIEKYYVYDSEKNTYSKAENFDMSADYYKVMEEDYNFYDQPDFDPILRRAIESKLAASIVLKLNGDTQKYQLLYSEALIAENNAIKASSSHSKNKSRGNRYWTEELGLE